MRVLRAPILVLVAVLSALLSGPVSSYSSEGGPTPVPHVAGDDSAELLSNDIVVKLTPEAHGKLKLRGGGKSNIASLNALATQFQVADIQSVIPRRNEGRELERWYVIRLAGESKEIKLADVRDPSNRGSDLSRFREAFGAFAANATVEFAEPNYIVRTTALPNDYYYGSGDLWGLRKINAEGAWDVSTGGSDSVVAVSDTGVDPTHPDLANRSWTNPGEIPGDGQDNDDNTYVDDVRGYDFVSNDGEPQDDHAHGTHVAGTIAASGANHPSGQPADGKAIVGLSWSAKIMALKFLNSSGSGDTAAGAATIDYARNNGAHVINMSWGGTGGSVLLDAALKEAHDAGLVLVAAAGNETSDAYHFEPANSPYVITVAATNSLDQRACFSNFGVKIDVGAPGGDDPDCDGRDEQILSLLSNQISSQRHQFYQSKGLISDCCYLKFRGTSMAAPHVAGVAALLKAKYPTYTNEQIRQILRITADDVGGKPWTRNTGHGRINAGAALAQTVAPPIAWIETPRYTNFGVTIVGDSAFQVTGKASGSSATYRIDVGAGEDPLVWTPVVNGTASGNFAAAISAGGLNLKSGSAITIRLVVTPQSGPEVDDRTKVIYDATIAPGFPIANENPDLNEFSLEVAAYAQPAIADLTDDGPIEIVGVAVPGVWGVGSTPQIKAWGADGSLRWTYGLGPYWAWPTSPLVADLVPGYPGKETVVVSTTGGQYTEATTAVTTVSATGSLVSQVTWTYMSNTCKIASAPAATDTDNDGSKEIILACQHSYKVVAVDPSAGTIKDESGYVWGAPKSVVVANIDGTGDEEVVVLGEWALSVLNSSNLDPHLLWTTPLVFNPPLFYVSKYGAVGNLDADADLEIVISGVWSGGGSEIRAYNPDKSSVWGTPPTYGPAPVDPGVILADMDQDGSLEIVVHEAGIHVFNAAGQELNGWWSVFPSEVQGSISTPADIDDDGELELLLYDGTALTAYKRHAGAVWTRNYGFSPVPPVAGDVDKDGFLDIVGHTLDCPDYIQSRCFTGGSHKVFFWKLPGVSVPVGTVYAPMVQFDPERSGRFAVVSNPNVTNDGDGLLDTLEPPGCVGTIDCDSDTILDGRDNCVTAPNSNQADADKDGAGDACDNDDDNDSIADASDNCPTAANVNQQNTDGGPEGDACDSDDDGDGFVDTSDNCPLVSNTNQADFDGDTWGDVCDSDDDKDALADIADLQCTLDSDCDDDYVSDGSADPDGAGQIASGPDNCRTVYNSSQADLDSDALGDACDTDDDGDRVADVDETPCGADPMNAAKRPERIRGDFAGVDDDGDNALLQVDGIDNDSDGMIDEPGEGIDEPLPAGAEAYDCDGDGFKGLVETGKALCANSTNDDNFEDSVVNDGCPGGPGQAGAFSEGQFHITTSDQDPCGSDGWPSDLVQVAGSENKVTQADMDSFSNTAPQHINKNPNEAGFDQRWDLIPGRGALPKWINVMDMAAITNNRPPMLNGASALGSTCPWAP